MHVLAAERFINATWREAGAIDSPRPRRHRRRQMAQRNGPQRFLGFKKPLFTNRFSNNKNAKKKRFLRFKSPGTKPRKSVAIDRRRHKTCAVSYQNHHWTRLNRSGKKNAHPPFALSRTPLGGGPPAAIHSVADEGAVLPPPLPPRTLAPPSLPPRVAARAGTPCKF